MPGTGSTFSEKTRCVLVSSSRAACRGAGADGRRHVGGLLWRGDHDERFARSAPEDDHLLARRNQCFKPCAHVEVGLVGRVLEIARHDGVAGEPPQVGETLLRGLGQQGAELIGGALGPLGTGRDKRLLDLAIGGPDEDGQDAGNQRGDEQWQAPPKRMTSRRGSIAGFRAKLAHLSSAIGSGYELGQPFGTGTEPKLDRQTSDGERILNQLC